MSRIRSGCLAVVLTGCVLFACTEDVPAPPSDVLGSTDGVTDRVLTLDVGKVADRGADTGPGDLLAEGVPDGCVKCATYSQCNDNDPCTKNKCGKSKCCESTSATSGTGCDDKDLCTSGDACDGTGKCAGTLYTCTAGQCQSSSTCDGKGGCIATHKPSGTGCDDKDACSSGDACDGKGKCAGTKYACVPGKCQATSVCDGKGGCKLTFLPSTAVCDDGNACTSADACDGKGGCAGASYTCVPGTCELTSVCDSKGGCKTSFKLPGAACDDKSLCTSKDTCDGKGVCAGTSCGSKNGYQNVYQCAGFSIQRAFRIYKCVSNTTGCTYKDIWKTQATCARTCASWCYGGDSKCSAAKAGTYSPNQSCYCDGSGKCKASTLKKELIAYWKLDDNKGSTASDSSGNSNHGTLKYPAWAYGKANIALDFDGTKDYVDSGNGPSFKKITNQISIAAWYRFDVDPYSITQSRSYIVDKGWAWRLWYSASGEGSSKSDQFFFDIWDWQGANTKGITWKKGTWYHIVCTYDGKHAVIYVDGKLNVTIAVSKKLKSSSYKVLLGADSEYGGSKYFWNGALDEVAVWSRALTAGEATDLYNANGVIK